MKIDWDKLRSLVPIYAYEYESPGVTPGSIKHDYWFPRSHPKGTEPPPGYTHIDYDESYENLMRALSEYLKLQPDEKAVWFNNATGEFSNSWPYIPGDKMMLDALEHVEQHPEWKLIVYRCESDSNFEFMGLMKIVTNVREKKA
jgi:hypothetical protein